MVSRAKVTTTMCADRAEFRAAQTSRSAPELLEAKFETFTVRFLLGCSGHMQLALMMSLKSMLEHRSIDLGENVAADLYDVVGPDTENVCVECCVMNLAQGKSVGNDGVSVLVTIRKYVRSIE